MRVIFIFLLLSSTDISFSFSQNLAPFLNEKSLFIYVDSASMRPISNNEYLYAEPFDYKNGLSIVYLWKDPGLYFEIQLIDKSLNILFSSTCKFEDDIKKLLRKVYNSDGNPYYVYCKLSHYDNSNNHIPDKYGLIGTNGIKLTDAIYASIGDFNEDIAYVMNFSGQYGFIDKNGKEVLKPSLPNLYSNFENGKALVQTSHNSWTFIDQFGNEIGRTNNINFVYHNGVYKTESNNYTLFKDKFGKTFLTIPYKTYGHFYNNESIFYISGSVSGYKKIGLIDFKGKVLTQPIFKDHEINYFNLQDQNKFYEGLAAVRTDMGWGFVNTKGQMVIKDKYSDVRRFSEGLSCVKDLYGWSYINSKGEIIINNTQLNNLNKSGESPYNFVNGFAKIPWKIEGIYRPIKKFYYIDRKGREYKSK